MWVREFAVYENKNHIDFIVCNRYNLDILRSMQDIP